MDTENNNEQFESEFERLPKELQGALLDFDLEGEIQKVALKNNLNVEQSGILFFWVNEVLYTHISAGELPQKLKEDGIPAEKIYQIILDLNGNIFQKIRNREKEIKENKGIEKKVDEEVVEVYKPINLDELLAEVEKKAEIEAGLEFDKILAEQEKTKKTEATENSINPEKNVEQLPKTENKTEPKLNFLEEKLNKISGLEPKESNHSLGNLTKDENKKLEEKITDKKPFDPYRELPEN